MLQGELSPEVKGIIGQVEGPKESHEYTRLAPLRKSFAAVATRGAGRSLGLEGPCVELGF